MSPVTSSTLSLKASTSPFDGRRLSSIAMLLLETGKLGANIPLSILASGDSQRQPAWPDLVCRAQPELQRGASATTLPIWRPAVVRTSWILTIRGQQQHRQPA